MELVFVGEGLLASRRDAEKLASRLMVKVSFIEEGRSLLTFVQYWAIMINFCVETGVTANASENWNSGLRLVLQTPYSVPSCRGQTMAVQIWV